MEPLDSVQPLAGEAPISLGVGLAVLAIGVLIFAYLVWKLAGEYRERKANAVDDSGTTPHQDEACDDDR